VILVCSKVETLIYVPPEYDGVSIYNLLVADLIRQTQGEKIHTEGNDVDDAGSCS
jgi:hypothetical protein